MKDIYVKFGKPLNGKEIKGESRDSGTGTTHKAPWFEVTSWTHFIRQPKSATASTREECGRRAAGQKELLVQRMERQG